MSKVDFAYESLDPEKSEIRLIRLLPEDPTAWQTTIDCEIFHANLTDKPE